MEQRPVRRRRRKNPYYRYIKILSTVLAVLCVIAVVVSCAPMPDPATNPSTSQTPGTTNGTSAPSTPPYTIKLPTTAPTVPTVSTVPTLPTVPTTPTQPTAPTTQPTEPTEPTQPTQPPIVVDVDQFFAESAFIGDSVTLALRNYCLTNKDALNGATILCAGSYSVRHALAEPGGKLEGWDVVSITYQGEKMRPEDALAACGAKRVFIMLGLNDIALVGIDKTIQNWGKLVQNIRAKCPDIEIYIQSGTPIQIGGEKGSLNNTNMDKYNVALQQFCADNGCYFVNVASALKNDQGGLREDYCSDDYCHLTQSGVKAWIQYLRDYAAGNRG